MAKTALIVGISGQDGSYLAELLLSKGYEVHGLVRRNSSAIFPNLENVLGKITLHYGDVITDSHIYCLINDLKPDECYNLAAQSHVGISFECPEYTALATGLGVLNILEAIKHFSPDTRFYQASTSELFGNSPAPQNELTPMIPESPYANAKLYGYHCVRQSRKFGIFACNGILYNHESPRRPIDFVTRKVTHSVAMIVNGLQNELRLGNLIAKRDWGYSPDYVKAMWLMLQQDKPDDYVIGTGETHSILELVNMAFNMVNLDSHKYVIIDSQFERPSDVYWLQADATKAHKVLGWHPTIKFEQLIKIMLDHDLKEVSRFAKAKIS